MGLLKPLCSPAQADIPSVPGRPWTVCSLMSQESLAVMPGKAFNQPCYI